MKKLGKNGNKALKSLHLLVAVMWIGGALALTIVLLVSNPLDGNGLYMKMRILQIIDDWVIIPGALGNFIIGIIYGVCTNWGFFKHRWITVKWILTTAQILFGTFFLGVWLNSNVELVDKQRELVFDNPTFWHNIHLSTVGSIIQLSILLLFIVISVFKPWRKATTIHIT